MRPDRGEIEIAIELVGIESGACRSDREAGRSARAGLALVAVAAVVVMAAVMGRHPTDPRTESSSAVGATEESVDPADVGSTAIDPVRRVGVSWDDLPGALGPVLQWDHLPAVLQARYLE